MAIEHARLRVVHKPWGSCDLRPWSCVDGSGGAVGELWFERAKADAPAPGLLLKRLFTSEPLSIQVHPDDTCARAIGLRNDKSEAWYILSARPGAQIDVGLTHRITPQELRAAIRNGSIVDLLHWRQVAQGDSIFIPAGTIDAIGAGIVLAEIQQKSDATFRLFDDGSQRPLHVDNGVAVANTGPLRDLCHLTRHTSARTVLVVSQYFVLEQVDLPAGSNWALLAGPETWILVLVGHAAIGLAAASVGQTILVAGDRAGIVVGARPTEGADRLSGESARRDPVAGAGEHEVPAGSQSPSFVEVPT
jgi:mannose-6-phosphate isomerase